MVDVPADYAGPGHLAVVAHPSGTLVGVGVGASITSAPKPIAMTYGTDGSVAVSVESDLGSATGTVDAVVNGEVVGTGALASGEVTISIPGDALSPGTYPLTIRYNGDLRNLPSVDRTVLTVAKAASKLTVSSRPGKVVVNKTRATLRITVDGNGDTPTGVVSVITGGRTYRVDLDNGKASVTIRPYSKTGAQSVVIRYFGDDLYKSTEKATTIKVVKK